MSLREKLQKQKEEKVAEKGQLAEQEARSQQEAETTELTEQLDSITARRDAMATIRGAVSEARDGMKVAKSTLRSERMNLRSLHKESVDEETGEALLPKPSTLARAEEYQDEEEIQSYNQAREQFRLSAQKVKDVEAQLSVLGIDNPSELLPGQLESLLLDAQKELNAETQSFLIEHPGVNPEMESRLREELIQQKSAEMVARFPRLLSVHKSFEDNYDQLSRSKNQDGDPLYPALSKALNMTSEALLSSSEKAELLEALQQTRENPAAPLDDIDTEAFTQALITKILNPGNSTVYDARITEIANEERRVNRPEGTDRKDVESLPSLFDLPAREQDAAKAERLAYIVAQAKARGVRDLTSAVSRITWEGVGGIQKLDAYESQKEQITSRREEIRKRFGSGVDGIESDERLVSSEQARLKNEESAAKDKHAEMLAIPAQLLRLNQLPAAVLDAPVTLQVSKAFGETYYNLSGDGISHDAEISALARKKEEDTRSFDTVSSSVAAASRIKDGIFGAPKEKKERIQKVRGEFKTSFDLDVDSLADMESGLRTIKERIDTTQRTIDQFVQDDAAMIEQLKPLRGAMKVLEMQEYTGSLRDLLSTIKQGVQAALPEQESTLEVIRKRLQENEEKRRALAQERSELEGERRGIDYDLDRIQKDGRALRAELQGKGYVSSDRSRY